MDEPYYSLFFQWNRARRPFAGKEIRAKAPNYVLKQETLYRWGASSSWLRCVTSKEGERRIGELYVGLCGAHEGGKIPNPQNHTDRLFLADLVCGCKKVGK